MVGILTNMSSYMTPNMVLEKQRHARQTELTILCEDLARISGAGMQTDRICSWTFQGPLTMLTLKLLWKLHRYE